jgi:hypothetical protein
MKDYFAKLQLTYTMSEVKDGVFIDPMDPTESTVGDAKQNLVQIGFQIQQ